MYHKTLTKIQIIILYNIFIVHTFYLLKYISIENAHMHEVKGHPQALKLDLLSLSELNESRKIYKYSPFFRLKYLQDIRHGFLYPRYDINICFF
jgi:hypothetical protein